jgi:uncharacterized Zn finger protein
METCKHKTRIRLYERTKTWTSTNLYRCQDCGEVIKIGLEVVKPKTMEKSIANKTKDALNVKEVSE